MHTLGTADRLFFDEMAYPIVRDAAPGRDQRRAGAWRTAGRQPDRATIASGASRE